jgi:hypothetical protein
MRAVENTRSRRLPWLTRRNVDDAAIEPRWMIRRPDLNHVHGPASPAPSAASSAAPTADSIHPIPVVHPRFGV